MLSIVLGRAMDLERRTLLAVTAGSLAIAGCLGDEEEADDTMAAADDSDRTDDSGETDDVDDADDADDADGADDANDAPADDGDPEDATVQVREHPTFGDILVGPEGMTLYNFDADTQGEPESACYDDCADAWPPLTVDGMPTAGQGVTAELTTFERDDGTTQVAAAGWPLYYFAADEEPGDVEGQGVNDVWWLLEPDGTLVRDDSADDTDEDDADTDDTEVNDADTDDTEEDDSEGGGYGDRGY